MITTHEARRDPNRVSARRRTSPRPSGLLRSLLSPADSCLLPKDCGTLWPTIYKSKGLASVEGRRRKRRPLMVAVAVVGGGVGAWGWLMPSDTNPPWQPN